MTTQYYAQQFYPNLGIGGQPTGFNHVIPCTTKPIECNDAMVTVWEIAPQRCRSWNGDKPSVFATPEEAFAWLEANTSWSTMYQHIDGQYARHFRAAVNGSYVVINAKGEAPFTNDFAEASIFEEIEISILELGDGWTLHPFVDERPKTSRTVKQAVRKRIKARQGSMRTWAAHAKSNNF